MRKGRRGSKGEGIGERRKGSHAEKHAPNSDWSLKCQLQEPGQLG